MEDIHSLSHTKWNCKYHVVFAPKYRRKVFYGDKRLEIGAILRQLCEWKGVNILNAEVCPDHPIPPAVTPIIKRGNATKSPDNCTDSSGIRLTMVTNSGIPSGISLFLISETAANTRTIKKEMSLTSDNIGYIPMFMPADSSCSISSSASS